MIKDFRSLKEQGKVRTQINPVNGDLEVFSKRYDVYTGQEDVEAVDNFTKNNLEQRKVELEEELLQTIEMLKEFK